VLIKLVVFPVEEEHTRAFTKTLAKPLKPPDTIMEEIATMSIVIENATERDLDTLHSIERECFALETFSKGLVAFLLRSPRSTSLMAKINGEIVGFIIALTYQEGKYEVGHILTIDVALKARRKGVGRELLKELERRLREKGVESCRLEVNVKNSTARRLYRSWGYGETGFIKGYYHSGEDCVTMNKNFR
jgi:ribosomal-protein-alanine N-acetyltransferase